MALGIDMNDDYIDDDNFIDNESADGSFGEEGDETDEEEESGCRPRKVQKCGRCVRSVPVQEDGSCCAEKLKAIEKRLEPALLTDHEKRGRKGSSKYHGIRLKQHLVDYAFDPRGHCLVHHSCLCEKLEVGAFALTSAGRSAREISGTPIMEVSKAFAIANALDVIVPADSGEMTLKQYLKTLDSLDKVKVPGFVRHGLAGRRSNNALTDQKSLFVDYVKEHRTNTGRTADSKGRYHGAQ